MSGTGGNDPAPRAGAAGSRSGHQPASETGRKVDFVVGGVQKGGSSALASYMLGHPEICMPRIKEVHYFNKDSNFPATGIDYSPYHAYFKPGPLHKVLGDATPTYIYWPLAAGRIADYNPAMKFIILLRNPVERAYSHWNMFVKEKREPLSFEEALRAEPERCRQNKPGQNAPTYMDRGYYSGQIARVWSLFPREQTLILRSESLKLEPAETLDRIAAFLGVSPFPVTRRIEVFKLPYEKPMSASARDFLRQVFAADIAKLEAMLGWDLSDWRK
jgi:hypothetical protein